MDKRTNKDIPKLKTMSDDEIFDEIRLLVNTARNDQNSYNKEYSKAVGEEARKRKIIDAKPAIFQN